MKKSNRKQELLQTIGNNVKSLRLARGMTQEQLAEKLDHSVNFVSLIELGKSGMSVETIVDICNILDVDVNCIFKSLVDYRIQNKDRKLIDDILSLAKEDKDIVEKLVEHLGKK